ncbi:hypothetical protein Pelo_2150 [Pelomyxa schiedti]|nr:hypothetical protein Pelo_2150 [Pelomyxa schiedti]
MSDSRKSASKKKPKRKRNQNSNDDLLLRTVMDLQAKLQTRPAVTVTTRSPPLQPHSPPPSSPPTAPTTTPTSTQHSQSQAPTQSMTVTQSSQPLLQHPLLHSISTSNATSASTRSSRKQYKDMGDFDKEEQPPIPVSMSTVPQLQIKLGRNDTASPSPPINDDTSYPDSPNDLSPQSPLSYPVAQDTTTTLPKPPTAKRPRTAKTSPTSSQPPKKPNTRASTRRTAQAALVASLTVASDPTVRTSTLPSDMAQPTAQPNSPTTIKTPPNTSVNTPLNSIPSQSSGKAVVKVRFRSQVDTAKLEPQPPQPPKAAPCNSSLVAQFIKQITKGTKKEKPPLYLSSTEPEKPRFPHIPSHPLQLQDSVDIFQIIVQSDENLLSSTACDVSYPDSNVEPQKFLDAIWEKVEQTHRSRHSTT